MNDNLKRLTASKRAHESELFESGIAQGREWARSTAEWKQLTNLDKRFGPFRESGWYDWTENKTDDAHVARDIVLVLEPEADESFVTEFWNGVPDREFVRGFCLGALDVYDEARKEP